jgi:hypothetical protein
MNDEITIFYYQINTVSKTGKMFTLIIYEPFKDYFCIASKQYLYILLICGGDFLGEWRGSFYKIYYLWGVLFEYLQKNIRTKLPIIGYKKINEWEELGLI